MRILIAEDDPMIGASLVRGLTDEGYSVDWVRDGTHAESALQDPLNHFQLALLDWGLPHKSGIDVLRALRLRGDNIPVLILTARDALRDRVEGLDLGADDFLVKPFEFAELKARIRALAADGARAASCWTSGTGAQDRYPHARSGFAQCHARRSPDSAHRARIRAATRADAAPRRAPVTRSAGKSHLRMEGQHRKQCGGIPAARAATKDRQRTD